MLVLGHDNNISKNRESQETHLAKFLEKRTGVKNNPILKVFNCSSFLTQNSLAPRRAERPGRARARTPKTVFFEEKRWRKRAPLAVV